MFYGKGFQDFRVMTIFSMSLDLNRKNAKTQTAYSFRYCKHCEHYQDAKFEALQFLEIRFIMNIKVMMAQAHIFIHFCAVVLLFFVITVIACFGL